MLNLDEEQVNNVNNNNKHYSLVVVARNAVVVSSNARVTLTVHLTGEWSVRVDGQHHHSTQHTQLTNHVD